MSRTAARTPSDFECGADVQFALPLSEIAHGLYGIDEQVEDYLLELDPISLNARQGLCQLRSHCDAILDHFAVDQADNLKDSTVRD